MTIIEPKSSGELITEIYESAMWYHKYVLMDEQVNELNADIGVLKDRGIRDNNLRYPSTSSDKLAGQNRKAALNALNKTLIKYENDELQQIENQIQSDFFELISKFNKKIEDESIDEILDATNGPFVVPTEIGPDLDIDLLHIYQTLAWMLLAKKYSNRIDQSELCWYCIAEAQYYRGKLDQVLPKKKTKKKTSAGGKSRANKISHTKDEVKKQIVNLKPGLGWMSTDQAKRELISYFKKAASPDEEKLRLSVPAIRKNLATWLKPESELGQFFKQHQVVDSGNDCDSSKTEVAL